VTEACKSGRNTRKHGDRKSGHRKHCKDHGLASVHLSVHGNSLQNDRALFHEHKALVIVRP